MGLFDKKFCDFCGNKISLLGNRKLADGNMCKDCAKDISPNLTGRRQLTVSDMKDHLAWREENKAKLASFSPTRTLGLGKRVHIDDNNKLLLVTSSQRYKEENVDLIEFSQVTGCVIDIDERQEEEYQKDAEGNEVSYSPPRYTYEYDFYVVIHLNHPWFDNIRFKVNNSTIIGRNSNEYRESEAVANEIKDALQSLHQARMDSMAQAAKPKTSVNCPFCGASTIPDAFGRCEYCGGAVGG
ncbi:MAG TPA: DUF4428 domain-containing protein [Oscillospiraceae bacterium]|nr:DUF4428 domain-containing protein [Oscillospiraceae bacterium]